MKRSVWLWILAVVVTLAAAVWQRVSGPTYPIRVRDDLGGFAVSGKLLRTHNTNADLPVIVKIEEQEAAPASDVPQGALVRRRFPTDDAWERVPMVHIESTLRAAIPAQPPAGKVEYRVELRLGDRQLSLPAERAAVARFKGDVSSFILGSHILFIFLAMLWSTRAGFEALARGDRLRSQAATAFILMAIGGLILGPLMQKSAFGAYWTGWPLGEDLTDNKLAVAVLAWLLAFFDAGVAERGRWWAVAAMIITLVIFSIPHSVLGSTLDYDSSEMISH